MMIMNWRSFPMACLAALVVACGGGGSAPPAAGGGAGLTPGNQTAGINGGGRWVAQGSVSRLGSVFVNGVRFDLDGAEIFVNGAPATPADLKPGQVLRLNGDVEVGGREGSAEIVAYENSLRGRITQLSLVDRTVTILGQELRVGLETIFAPEISPGALESLSVGNDVIVSAFVDAEGRLRASRIGRDPSPGTAEVIGMVSDQDTAARRFRINGLVVDYSLSGLGFPSLDPLNGNTVRVIGDLPAPGATLVAASIALRQPLVGGPDENVNLEGLVTRFAGAGDFDVAGQRIVTNASTVFVGTTGASLKANDFVDVQGKRDAADGLVAVRIEGFPAPDIQMEARLDAVDVAAGTVGLLGITVHTTARTRFYDDDDERLSLADLRAGDEVEIAGYLTEGRFVAVRVERDDDTNPGSEVAIEGPVTDLADPDFRIGGIRIVTDAQTEFDDISRSEFFGTATGRRAEVDGSWNGSYVQAEEVELDD